MAAQNDLHARTAHGTVRLIAIFIITVQRLREIILHVTIEIIQLQVVALLNTDEQYNAVAKGVDFQCSVSLQMFDN